MNTSKILPDARSISWRAIVGGAVVALSIHLLLVILGTGISALIARKVDDSGAAARTLAIGTTISWTLSALLALWAGGFVAGRVGAAGNEDSGRMHGFIMWSAATVGAFLLMLLGLGGAVAGTAGIAKGTVAAVGTAAAQAAPDITKETKQMISGYTDEITIGEKPLPARTKRELAANVKALVTADASQRPAAHTAVVNTLVNSGAMAAPNANETVDEWVKSYDTTKAELESAAATAATKAREAADSTAAAGGVASIWIFVAFWVGALASVCGGHLGAAGWMLGRKAVVEVHTRPIPAT